MSNFNINRVILAGNMTGDAELRQTGSGKEVANFSIAVNESRKQGDEWVEEAHFFDITVWGYQAKMADEQGGKGVPCVVEGRLRQERWEDRETGAKRNAVKVTADKFIPYARPQKKEQTDTNSEDDSWLFEEEPVRGKVKAGAGQTDDIGFH